MIYLGNAFSLQMLQGNTEYSLKIHETDLEEVKKLSFLSVVGHEDTANVLTGLLGKPVQYNRENIVLHKKDVLYVAQITGGRLMPGAMILPEGVKFKFYRITFSE